MKPKDFPEVNVKLIAPDSMSDTCFSMYASKTTDGRIISCWTLDDEEIEHIKKTKEVWLSIHAEAQPPLLVSTQNPFGETESFTEDRLVTLSNLIDNISKNRAGGMILMGVNTVVKTLTLDEFEYVVATLPHCADKTNLEVKKIASEIDTICLGMLGQSLLIVRR